MIVSVLGGSSQSTPVLVNWLAEQKSPGRYRIRLAGRHPDRLGAVERACKIVAPRINTTGYGPAKWAECLDGSDLVLIQVRIGDYQGRQRDEQLALDYGIPGDEGLGPAGLAAAVRTWPELKLLLQLIRRNAPNALPLLLTSPGSLLVRLASLEWINWPLYGICELPYTTLKTVCADAKLSPEDVTFSYTGVNHIGFLHSVKCRDTDVIEQYAKNPNIPFSSIVRDWHAVPLKYLRLHFERSAVVREQLASGFGVSRAYVLITMQSEAMKRFQAGDAEAIREILMLRNANWYAEAVGPFIAAMAGDDVERPFFLSSAEEDGEVQERAFRIRRGILSPLPYLEPPATVSELTGKFIAYERAAASAIKASNCEAMADALRLHPWLERADDADKIARDILRVWT
ncbi:MAG: hypothetical protein M3Y57_10745 [Acidobacteriota bacterium]|nr:hypothetical protein [Acidobacteriota bacterium]